jgi:CelD/BcsL family acetyltransferase involved in cellulose biosynthesis
MQTRNVHTISLHEQPETWERLRASSHDRTLFNSAAWLSVLAQVFQRKPQAVILTDAAGEAAGIPLLLRQRGPLRLSAALPITLYAGMIRRTGSDIDVTPLLQAVEQQSHFVSLSTVWTAAEQSLLTARGWRLRPQQTIRMELGDLQAVWEGYNQSLRRKLRRVLDGGFRLDADPPTPIIIGMFEQSYSRHGIRPPLPGSTVERWLNELRRRDIARCFAARQADGRFAAVRVMLRDGAMLYDWLAGADPAIAPSASHWLLHTVLQRFSDDNCREFDFMGANTPGVTDFKRSFGGRISEYHEAEWYRPSLLRHLNSVRNRGLRLRRGLR